MTDESTDTSALGKALAVIQRLKDEHISYTVDSHWLGSLMVTVAPTPAERWEIEFMLDGEVDVERFLSQGVERDTSDLSALWVLTEEETS